MCYANATVNLSSVDRLRKAVGMQLTDKAAVIQNDFNLSQSMLTGNYISQITLAKVQRAEQGESADNKTTRGDITELKWNKFTKAATPIGVGMAIAGGTLPGWSALLFGWSVFAFQMAVASVPGANKYPVTSLSDAVNVTLERLGYQSKYDKLK